MEFPFNSFYKVIDLTQGNHMVCFADDRCSHTLFCYDLICDNNTMMVLNFLIWYDIAGLKKINDMFTHKTVTSIAACATT